MKSELYAFTSTVCSEEKAQPWAFDEPDYINISERANISYLHPLIIIISKIITGDVIFHSSHSSRLELTTTSKCCSFSEYHHKKTKRRVKKAHL